MWGIEGSIANALQAAPENLFMGIAHAMTYIPDKIKGAALFGESIWNGMSPEDQKTVEDAIRKAIIAAAKAYVKSGG